jgi:hypothetical protein
MDQVVAQALTLYKKIIAGEKESVIPVTTTLFSDDGLKYNRKMNGVKHNEA